MESRPREQIEQLLKDYRDRGEMSRRAFCESRSIPLSTLDYYMRRYGSNKKVAPTKFVKVRVEPAAAAITGSFSLVFANGRRIESSWNFSDAELLRLIRVVEAA